MRREGAGVGRGTERGSASLLVVAMVGVLLTVALGLTGVAGIIGSHRSAQAAADLAALAAASPAGAGCASAAEVAAANDAHVVTCERAGREARVRVGVRGPRLLGRAVEVTAEARAGPG